MTEQPPRPASGMPPPGWRQPPVVPPPSGLMPSGPPRPRYREPHPVRIGALLAGVAGSGLWLLLFGMLGRDLRGYAWWTLLAGCVAWLVAWVLVRLGDRGVAAGVAMGAAVGVSVAAGSVAVRWVQTGDWPMW